MIYDLLAGVYDKINAELDYSAWADFIEKIIADNYGKRAELILDLAAGTGKMTLELASRGYDMTAVDGSPEMLDIGRMEAQKRGLDGILWLLQDMRSFELYGTVEAVVCTLDGINHLTSKKDVEKCFSLVHNYLVPDGLFVFDINAPYKFENVYGTNAYILEEKGVFCAWQNAYNPKTQLCRFDISVFERNRDGSYFRSDSSAKERMYTPKSIKEMLEKTGFSLLETTDGYRDGQLNDKSERIVFVAKANK